MKTLFACPSFSRSLVFSSLVFSRFLARFLVWFIIGSRPLTFCRSATESTVPVKTSRSSDLSFIVGSTAGRISPLRMISTRFSSLFSVNPACAMVFSFGRFHDLPTFQQCTPWGCPVPVRKTGPEETIG